MVGQPTRPARVVPISDIVTRHDQDSALCLEPARSRQ
jgi:hypothetical protein